MNNSFCMSLGYLLRTSDKDLDGQTIASVCITGALWLVMKDKIKAKKAE